MNALNDSGMTMYSLSKQTGLPYTTINRLVNEKLSINNCNAGAVFKIASALGVQMDSDRLGCGTNLYGTRETIIEEYGKDVCWTEFSIGSDFVKNLIKFTVDEDTMAIAKNACYLEVAEEDGMTRFRLIKADNMSCLNITELTLVVHDNVTNEVHEYEMEREIARSGWKGIVHSDIPFSNVGNIDCEVYISVDEFDHYLLNKSSADELGMWDVRWDFE